MEINNKLKLNGWGAFLFFMSVLFFVGCSEGSDISEPTKNAIAFNCSTSGTRVTETTLDNLQYFRVSAVWNKGGGNYEPFMNNQLVEKQDGDWIYSPIKLWPALGSVNFFAHAPANSKGIIKTYLDTSINHISIEYELSTNYHEQEDFMLATNLNKTANPIKLDFKHMLSFVKFQARSKEAGVNFRIKEIKIGNLNSEGILTKMADNSIWWYGQNTLRDYVVYQKYSFETQSSTYKEVGDLMVLPQAQADAVMPIKIIVICDVIGISQNDTITYQLSDDFKFEMGKKHTFYLDLHRNLLNRSKAQNAAAPTVECSVASEPIEKF